MEVSWLFTAKSDDHMHNGSRSHAPSTHDFEHARARDLEHARSHALSPHDTEHARARQRDHDIEHAQQRHAQQREGEGEGLPSRSFRFRAGRGCSERGVVGALYHQYLQLRYDQDLVQVAAPDLDRKDTHTISCSIEGPRSPDAGVPSIPSPSTNRSHLWHKLSLSELLCTVEQCENEYMAYTQLKTAAACSLPILILVHQSVDSECRRLVGASLLGVGVLCFSAMMCLHDELERRVFGARTRVRDATRCLHRRQTFIFLEEELHRDVAGEIMKYVPY